MNYAILPGMPSLIFHNAVSQLSRCVPFEQLNMASAPDIGPHTEKQMLFE